eukprot:TRINITY_DN3985_c0_g1_i1.p1 TRINITY_DN3985_c0_g1~~TRINITY_DN3985_c0_g1_i1.p1  ORF type:complete len:199 (-),score=73.73 TRINITY_DN3985_c0_g1_i1:147-743(-)
MDVEFNMGSGSQAKQQQSSSSSSMSGGFSFGSTPSSSSSSASSSSGFGWNFGTSSNTSSNDSIFSTNNFASSFMTVSTSSTMSSGSSSSSTTIKKEAEKDALCRNCGKNWTKGQYSAPGQCRECSGVALESPCCLCDGRCGKKWRRSVQESNESHIAVFIGSCNLSQMQRSGINNKQWQLLEDDMDLVAESFCSMVHT